MNAMLILHTIAHLKLQQLFFQLFYRLFKPSFKELSSFQMESVVDFSRTIQKDICCKKDIFSFLNISEIFTSWNETKHGMLWAYNLNYMDWLMQEDMSFEEGAKWMDKFIAELPDNKVGLDPYPIALRGINWIKFIALHGEEIPVDTKKRWDDSLYSQYVLLAKKLEYHLLGNHLLEDAYSLYIASIYFSDKRFYRKTSRLLYQELNEQILDDGTHYEQSPMYHCILLDRLLDCYNISSRNLRFDTQADLNLFLKEKAVRMLGHLGNIMYQDKTVPLFNDSANRIAPTPVQLFDYATRLGLQWKPIPLGACGYRKFITPRVEAIMDVGNIMASYQPGHSHADTFHYELRVDGKPFVVDTGISTYDKTSRRQYERSTSAHNTVSIGGKNSSEVWGGFRIGKRAKVQIEEDTNTKVKASHNGFGKSNIHTRSFELKGDIFEITDSISSDKSAVSYIHLAPDVQILSYTLQEIKTNRATIQLTGFKSIKVLDGQISTEYNTFQKHKIVELEFVRESKYSIYY